MEQELAAAGYEKLYEEETWDLQPGRTYMVSRNGSSLIAFALPEHFPSQGERGFLITASHSDSPSFKIKEHPELRSENYYVKLNVEPYGGQTPQTWFDRPLSMAGRVCLRGKDAFHPEERLVDFERPLLMVPNLANHIKRDNEKYVEPNKQIDMLPVLTILTEKLNKDSFFLDLLAKELDAKKEEILDYEFYLYNWEKGTLWGMNEEFYSAPRLDNLTSVEACLTGLLTAAQSGKNDDTISLIALYDNEEVGSRTKQGAASTAADRLMEKLFLSLGFDREQYLSAMFKSFLLSMDVGHAYHPSKPDNYDPKNHTLLNDGVGIKMSSTQSYATVATAVSVIEELCKKDGIPYKKFSNRSDIRGGSTLGSISSCQLAVKAVDAGVGLWAMHSTMETMGAEDQHALNSLVKAFFEN